MKQCTFHDVGPGRQDRRLFELVEQAYNRRERVLIFSRDGERAASLDRTLWIMKQEAFIPHKVFSSDETDPGIPVAIVTAEVNPIEAQILIADGHCKLDFAFGFETVHEFVDRTSPQMQESCRDRYRAYREKHVPVEHIKE